MLRTFAGRCSILFIVTLCIAVALQSQDDTYSNNNHYRSVNNDRKPTISNDKNQELQRSKRLLFYKKKAQQPGFFGMIGQLFYQQVNETTSAYRQISKIIRSNFIDPNEVTTTTTPSSDPNATTTMAPYRITREDFFGILRRNLRGLIRLFQVEIKDALNQSRYSISDYRKEFSNEIGRIIG
ncbi:uncharacterized protein LOC123293652 [Chrysoperla carnea]|uniref:uncharacterized protein LOC123293652 n=1 Tax=Chrysoperla carnea TaxID=189513 RepID=UPI001D098C7D|nr:uncharacterized protein LOC123293652 [Chrysoperla carnea]